MQTRKVMQQPIEKRSIQDLFSSHKRASILSAGSTQEDLIKQAKGGDRAAFDKLVVEILPQVLAVAYRMLNDRAEAEDLAQDVMVKLWQNLANYDEEKAKLSTWLYRITANRCLDTLRRKRPEQLDDDYDEAIPPGQFEALAHKELGLTVETALQSLPERQRLALILFHYEGASLAETSQALDCSIDAVESLLARARRKLKTLLAPTWQQINKQEA